MSQDIVLCSIIKRTFALLLVNDYDLGENLVETLDTYIERLPRCGMLTSLDHLKIGTVSLLDCVQILKNTVEARFANNSSDESELRRENGSNSEISKPKTVTASTETDSRDKAKQPCSSFNPNYAGLREELQIIKESDEFKKAVNYFKKANENLATILKDNDKKGTEFTKITATKVRVISEILGNLTNLADAAENCKQYILKLHESFNVHKDIENMDSVMHINVVLFYFMKEFTRTIVMLNWPMIDGQGPEKFHPILGELPIEIVPPDPFTDITDISKGKDKVQIDSCISAINCIGDIFAKEKASTDIVRITPNCNKWYSFNDDLERKVISISIDCANCKTSAKSQCGETSTQSCAANPNTSDLVCCGKMYILVRSKFQETFRYFLYIIDMNGAKEHEEELGFLERNATEVPKVKIFCINDKKVIILDVTRRIIHVCDNKGIEKNTIDAIAYLRNTNAKRPPIFTYNGEMICLESKLNFLSKINVYNIVVGEEGSFLEKTNEIKVTRAVQAVAFNHKLNEITILCYTWSLQYHLVTYKDGKLILDIKLRSDKYWTAGLISNPNGRMALLDDFKLLHLK